MTVRTLNGYSSRFAFVQVSSFLMFLGVNLSFFFFAHFFVSVVGRRLGVLFQVRDPLRAAVVCFMIGAILSTFHNSWEGNDSAVRASLSVLPNYLYWGMILLLMTYLAPVEALDYRRLFKAIGLAVIVSIIYYVILQRFIADSRFFKFFGPNNFSFLLICYTPYLVYFLRQRVHPIVAIGVLGILLILQLKEGRRAGFGLVLMGGMGAYLVHQLKFNSIGRLMKPVILLLLGYGMLQTAVVEQQIRARSARVHRLLYSSTEQVLSKDRSFLIRRAMVEKGLVLFRNDMLFGVGLNNFTKVHAQIDGDFVGAEYVVNKDIYSRISSHNSYINVLAEGGLVLCVPFAVIILTLFLGSLRRFNRFQDPEKVIFISYSVMLVHMYFTNGITNSLAWFNIGLISYALLRLRIERSKTAARPAPSFATIGADLGSERDGGGIGSAAGRSRVYQAGQHELESLGGSSPEMGEFRANRGS